jgi:hypothetical protein
MIKNPTFIKWYKNERKTKKNDRNIENGDYFTSSDYLGYGEKQDDDSLHNYTVAKATIDCSFELDSIYYNCIELNYGIRAALLHVLIIVDK